MWRNWSKGLQQGFKQNVNICVENPNNKKNRKTKHLCCIAKLLPRCTVGKFQHLDACISKHTNEDKKSNENTTKNLGNHTFFEAFGWSGALVFGWLISKQWWLKQTWSKDCESCIYNYKTIHNPSITDLLLNSVNTQPPANYVLNLPQHKSVSCESTGNTGIEDEFEAAAKELQEIHEKAMGESLNRQGIASLSKSSGTEAIKLFKRASELNYPPASFNLGQCCELGIGTKQDFKQAAEWYKIASDQGHPTAMYNLGVFYAHGWGGLQSDVNIAKRLFLKAAELGQPDAKVALDKESKSSYNLIHKVKTSQISIINEPVSMKPIEYDLYIDKITYKLTDSVFKREFGTNSRPNWEVPIKSSVAF